MTNSAGSKRFLNKQGIRRERQVTFLSRKQWNEVTRNKVSRSHCIKTPEVDQFIGDEVLSSVIGLKLRVIANTAMIGERRIQKA